MSKPLRTAYSRKELSEALNKWMIDRWGESPANLSPCHRDRYYRDNGLIYHFIADHFPTEKEAMDETPNPDDQDKWENHLIKPIAKMMREKGIARMVISVKNGKAEYILDPTKQEP